VPDRVRFWGSWVDFHESRNPQSNALMTAALDMLGVLVRSDGSLIGRAPHIFATPEYTTRGFGPELLEPYKREVWRYDPLHPVNLSDRSARVFDMRDWRNANRVVREYDDFLRGQGGRYRVRMYLRDADGEPYASIVLARGERAGAYTQAEMQALRAVIPYLEMTMQPHIGRPGRAFADLYGLTEREDVVARMVAEGRSSQEVAAELRIGLATVKTHLVKIYAKSGVRTRAELATRLHAGRAMAA
jgi:DNA-binding CsgD family transcriptional regulator